MMRKILIALGVGVCQAGFKDFRVPLIACLDTGNINMCGFIWKLVYGFIMQIYYIWGTTIQKIFLLISLDYNIWKGIYKLFIFCE